MDSQLGLGKPHCRKMKWVASKTGMAAMGDFVGMINKNTVLTLPKRRYTFFFLQIFQNQSLLLGTSFLRIMRDTGKPPRAN